MTNPGSLRSAWTAAASSRFCGRFLGLDRGGGSYLDSSISRTLFASVDMANGFASTDIPGSR